MPRIDQRTTPRVATVMLEARASRLQRGLMDASPDLTAMEALTQAVAELADGPTPSYLAL